MLWFARDAAEHGRSLLVLDAVFSPWVWDKIKQSFAQTSGAAPWGWVWPSGRDFLWEGQRLYRPAISDPLSAGEGGFVWLEREREGLWSELILEASDGLRSSPLPPALLIHWDAIRPGLSFGSYQAMLSIARSCIAHPDGSLLMLSHDGHQIPEEILADCDALILEDPTGSLLESRQFARGISWGGGSSAGIFEPQSRPSRRLAYRPAGKSAWEFGVFSEHSLALDWDFRGRPPFHPLNPTVHQAESSLLDAMIPHASAGGRRGSL